MIVDLSQQNFASRYSVNDQKFFSDKIKRMLAANILEPFQSSWRAQVLVVDQELKKSLVIDYSTAIDRFTQLPLPRMEELMNKAAQDKFCTTIDLQSAYQQIPIAVDQIFTSFEACVRLYQCKLLSFGVTNGVLEKTQSLYTEKCNTSPRVAAGFRS